jgi:LAS superfamily LD-carboxypeptidase LdcB
MTDMQFLQTHLKTILGILLIISFVGIVMLSIQLKKVETDILSYTEKNRMSAQEMQDAIALRDARVFELETLLNDTKNLLQETLDENEDLEDDLRDEKDRNEEFEDQIEKIGSTVGTLDKLAKTDKELLMKYSKVYFLNEHYMPPKLKELPTSFVSKNDGDPEFIHKEVYTFLIDMLEDAKDDNVMLTVVSAFRSYDEQRALKGVYSVTYGSGANTFSADQGYSEHQLGTTVDFSTEGLSGGLQGFDGTAAYEWLIKNAHKYGFVLSYPKNNAYYIFEPWHWRFVGTDLARDLHEDGKFFYDVDQREIDTYLVSIFD